MLEGILTVAVSALAGNLLPRITGFAGWLRDFLNKTPAAPTPAPVAPAPVLPAPVAPVAPDLAAVIRQIIEGVLAKLLPMLPRTEVAEDVKLFQSETLETVIEKNGFRITFPAPLVERVLEPGPVEPA